MACPNCGGNHGAECRFCGALLPVEVARRLDHCPSCGAGERPPSTAVVRRNVAEGCGLMKAENVTVLSKGNIVRRSPVPAYDLTDSVLISEDDNFG